MLIAVEDIHARARYFTHLHSFICRRHLKLPEKIATFLDAAGGSRLLPLSGLFPRLRRSYF